MMTAMNGSKETAHSVFDISQIPSDRSWLSNTCLDQLITNVELRPKERQVMKNNQIVYLLDDDRRVLDSLQDLVRSAGYRAEAFLDSRSLMRSVRPDVPACLLVDVDLGDCTGFDLLAEPGFSELPLTTVFMSGCSDIATALRALRCGAIDFLTKPIDDDVLLAALAAALEEAHARWSKRQSVSRVVRKFETLTTREREVMPFVVKGFLNKQTAYELGISQITVQTHRGRIMKKMEAESLPHLIRLAAQLGID